MASRPPAEYGTERLDYEFGPFRLNKLSRSLVRDGQEIPLTAKACEVLLLLVRSAGRTVTKEEFMREVWPDTFVEESNLADNISTLRQLLGDDARDPHYIRTVPKVGYRFLAPVVATEPALYVHEKSRVHVVIEEEDRRARLRALGPYATGALASIAVVALVLAGVLAARRGTPRAASPRAAAPPAPLVQPVTTFPDQEFSPALSPDGRLVAFAWTNGSREAINLYVKQADLGAPVRLTSAIGRDGNPAWSPDGRTIAFTRLAAHASESGIYLVPALGGVERRLFSAAEMGGLSWSPDGKTLAFAHKHSSDDPYAISLLDVQTLETRPLTRPAADTYGDYWLTFSPDGREVAFARIGDESGAADLYVAAVAGGEPRRVTFADHRIVGVAWAPRRNVLIFSSPRNDRQILYEVSPVGGTPKPLDPTVEDALNPTVSRNGEALAYTRLMSETNIERVALGGQSAQPARLISSSHHDLSPAVSPDEHRIAFESNRSGDDEIWIANADGSSPVQLTAAGHAGAISPAWSPDGTRIAFVSRPQAVSEVFVIPAVGGRAVRLTRQINCAMPRFSRDGAFVYFSSNRGGRWQVWRVPSAGGEAVQVTQGGGYECEESRDGRFLYYTKRGYDADGLYRQPVRGGAEELVYPLAQLSSRGDWTLSAHGVYFIHRYDRVNGANELAKNPGIRFFDFDTKSVKEVAPLADPGSDPGLNILDGGRSAVLSRAAVNSDVMLIRNYQ